MSTQLNKAKSAASLVGLLIFTTLHAQNTLHLTLDDAIKMGLANNKSIGAEALNLELDADKIKESASALYPAVSGNAALVHYFNIPVQYAAANVLNPAALADKFVGLKLVLPNSFDAGVNVNWALYNQAVFSTLKFLKAENNLTSIQLLKDRSDLAFTISQLYYGIVFSRKEQDNLLQIAGNIDHLLTLLQTNYDNGLLLKTELDKVKVNKATVSSQLTDLSTAIETQYNLLKVTLGLPANTGVQLSDTDFVQSLHPVTDTAANPESSFDLQLIRAQIELTRLERKTITASKLPALGLTYNLSYNAVSPDLNKIVNTPFSYPMQFIGLNLSVPIFSGFNNVYKLRSNAVRSRQETLQKDFLTERLSTDITNARLRYNTSLTNMNANQASVNLAQELYDQSLLQYHQGTILLTDVLTFETTLEQALTQYFNSVSSALLSLLDYKKATNTVLSQQFK